MGADEPRWEDLAAAWPNRDMSEFVSAGGLRWHVQRGGRGPVVLLLHGTGSANFTWGGMLPRLVPACSVVAPDLPGHGFTTGAGRAALSLTGMARAIAALMATLGAAPALIVGHSAGAAVALRLAADRRLLPQRVVGLNPAIIPPPATYRMLFAPILHRVATTRMAAAGTAGLASFTPLVESLLHSTGSHVPAERARLYQRFFRSARHCRDVLTMMADWALPDLIPDLARVPCPVTLVCGRRDTWVPLQSLYRYASAIPEHTVLEVAGGHLFHEDHPTEAADVILGALHSAPGSGAASEV